MPDLRGSKTEVNLRAAFSLESAASRRFLYFAQQADVEGQPGAANIFRTAAEGETGHALGHLDFLLDAGDPATGKPMGSTEDNLAAALDGERQEADEVYPGFAAVARQEGFDEIADWMDSLSEAEQQHAQRFSAALDEIREVG